jgi:hypothetical protein
MIQTLQGVGFSGVKSIQKCNCGNCPACAKAGPKQNSIAFSGNDSLPPVNNFIIHGPVIKNANGNLWVHDGFNIPGGVVTMFSDKKNPNKYLITPGITHDGKQEVNVSEFKPGMKAGSPVVHAIKDKKADIKLELVKGAAADKFIQPRIHVSAKELEKITGEKVQNGIIIIPVRNPKEPDNINSIAIENFSMEFGNLKKGNKVGFSGADVIAIDANQQGPREHFIKEAHKEIDPVIPKNQKDDPDHKTPARILNGGFSTRLRGVINDSKAILHTPSGLEMQFLALAQLVGHGVVPKNFKHDYFGGPPNVNIGNGGEYYEYLKNNNDVEGNSILMPADGIHTFNVKDALDAHNDKKSALTLICAQMDPGDTVGKYGVVKVKPAKDDSGMYEIIEFTEKPETLAEAEECVLPSRKVLASPMIYIFTKQSRGDFQEMREEFGKEKGFDKEYDIGGTFSKGYAKKCANGDGPKFYAYAAKGDWSDIGNTRDYFETFRDCALNDKFKDLPKPLTDKIKENVITTKNATIVCNTTQHGESIVPLLKDFMGTKGLEGLKGDFIITPDYEYEKRPKI